MKLDIETIAGVLAAQKRIDNIIPVIASRNGLLQELQAKASNLTREEAIELMNALLALQSHCRAMGLAELETAGHLQSHCRCQPSNDGWVK
jgi:hypothetical protein